MNYDLAFCKFCSTNQITSGGGAEFVFAPCAKWKYCRCHQSCAVSSRAAAQEWWQRSCSICHWLLWRSQERWGTAKSFNSAGVSWLMLLSLIQSNSNPRVMLQLNRVTFYTKSAPNLLKNSCTVGQARNMLCICLKVLQTPDILHLTSKTYIAFNMFSHNQCCNFELFSKSDCIVNFGKLGQELYWQHNIRNHLKSNKRPMVV